MSVFDWFKSNKTADDAVKTRYKRTSRPIVDYTESLSCNDALTKGIYRNTYPGMKLAGFGYNVINTPVTFMGLPILDVDGDEDLSKLFQEEIILPMSQSCRANHTVSHRDGTSWIYPELRNGSLFWRFIPDETITRIIKDVDTGEMISIRVEEQMTINNPTQETDSIVEKRVIYTKDRILTTYSDIFQGSDVVNVAGILPVPFANNGTVNEIRGYSEYERLLADLKNYHDVDLAESVVLSKFVTKMVQTVDNYKNWLKNNGFAEDGSDIDELTLSTIDLIINSKEEKTEFIFPSDATSGYQSKLKNIFHKLVELSGIPEIAWGLKTEGNLASVEENMAILMQYCQGKQNQKTDPYRVLVEASARLLNQAFILPKFNYIDISWDAMESTSEKTKSEIFKNYSEGISKLVDSAAMTKEQLFNLWQKRFPGITEKEFEPFTSGLADMVGHVVSTKSSAESMFLQQGETPI